MNEDLQEAEKRLEEHKTTLNVDETKARIKELDETKKQLDAKIRELDQEQEEVIWGGREGVVWNNIVNKQKHHMKQNTVRHDE